MDGKQNCQDLASHAQSVPIVEKLLACERKSIARLEESVTLPPFSFLGSLFHVPYLLHPVRHVFMYDNVLNHTFHSMEGKGAAHEMA